MADKPERIVMVANTQSSQVSYMSQERYRWSDFTERARTAIFAAQLDAARQGDLEVGPGALILAVIRDSECAAMDLLVGMGIRISGLKKSLERLSTGRLVAPAEVETLSPEGVTAMEFAYDVAAELDDRHIGTEHLLLGASRSARGDLAEALRKHRVQYTHLRNELDRRHEHSAKES